MKRLSGILLLSGTVYLWGGLTSAELNSDSNDEGGIKAPDSMSSDILIAQNGEGFDGAQSGAPLPSRVYYRFALAIRKKLTERYPTAWTPLWINTPSVREVFLTPAEGDIRMPDPRDERNRNRDVKGAVSIREFPCCQDPAQPVQVLITWHPDQDRDKDVFLYGYINSDQMDFSQAVEDAFRVLSHYLNSHWVKEVE